MHPNILASATCQPHYVPGDKSFPGTLDSAITAAYLFTNVKVGAPRHGPRPAYVNGRTRYDWRALLLREPRMKASPKQLECVLYVIEGCDGHPNGFNVSFSEISNHVGCSGDTVTRAIAWAVRRGVFKEPRRNGKHVPGHARWRTTFWTDVNWHPEDQVRKRKVQRLNRRNVNLISDLQPQVRTERNLYVPTKNIIDLSKAPAGAEDRPEDSRSKESGEDGQIELDLSVHLAPKRSLPDHLRVPRPAASRFEIDFETAWREGFADPEAASAWTPKQRAAAAAAYTCLRDSNRRYLAGRRAPSATRVTPRSFADFLRWTARCWPHVVNNCFLAIDPCRKTPVLGLVLQRRSKGLGLSPLFRCWRLYCRRSQPASMSAEDAKAVPKLLAAGWSFHEAMAQAMKLGGPRRMDRACGFVTDEVWEGRETAKDQVKLAEQEARRRALKRRSEETGKPAGLVSCQQNLVDLRKERRRGWPDDLWRDRAFSELQEIRQYRGLPVDREAWSAAGDRIADAEFKDRWG